MDEITPFLRNVPIFASFSEEELNNLAKIVQKKTYKKKEAILKEGEIGDSFFIICSGLAKVVTKPCNKKILINIMGEKEFFGEMAFLNEKKRSATVIAHSDLELIVIFRKDFVKYILSNYTCLVKLLQTISERLRKADRKCEIFAFFQGDKRLSAILYDLAREYGKKDNGKVSIDLGLTHNDLAKMVGLTREATTLILNKFVKANLIEIGRRRIFIPNTAPLIEIFSKYS
ncbi:Crp/Fnr family transcriptional regulator [bacterium]|nr:Crp/Fnr family transcriptional regulator [bacterium]MBU1598823.1 Crp/Fnr family transcriptional regulator [bacterium]